MSDTTPALSDMDISQKSSQSLGSLASDFFRGVVEEFKKITWPTLPQVLSQTLVVLVMIAFMTLFVWMLDYGINWVLSFISPFHTK
jgi:preprotein translocase subunit SecE